MRIVSLSRYPIGSIRQMTRAANTYDLDVTGEYTCVYLLLVYRIKNHKKFEKKKKNVKIKYIELITIVDYFCCQF